MNDPLVFLRKSVTENIKKFPRNRPQRNSVLCRIKRCRPALLVKTSPKEPYPIF